MSARQFVRKPVRAVGASAGDTSAPVAAAAPAGPVAATLKEFLPTLPDTHIQAAAECVNEIMMGHIGCGGDGKVPTTTVYLDNEISVEFITERLAISGGATVADLDNIVRADGNECIHFSTDDIFEMLQAKCGLSDDKRNLAYIKRIRLEFTNVTGTLIASPAELGTTSSIFARDVQSKHKIVQRAISLTGANSGSAAVDIEYTDKDMVEVVDHLCMIEAYPNLYDPDGRCELFLHRGSDVPPATDLAHKDAEKVLSVCMKVDPDNVHAKAAAATIKGFKAMPEGHVPGTHPMYGGPVAAAMAHAAKRQEETVREWAAERMAIPGPFLGRSQKITLLNTTGSEAVVTVNAIVTCALSSRTASH